MAISEKTTIGAVAIIAVTVFLGCQPSGSPGGGKSGGPASLPGDGTVAGCAGDFDGTFGGVEGGSANASLTREGFLDCAVYFDSGDILGLTGTVSADGMLIIPPVSGVNVTGQLNLNSCRISGGYSGPDGSGTWQLNRTTSSDDSGGGGSASDHGSDGGGQAEPIAGNAPTHCDGDLQGTYWGGVNGSVEASLTTGDLSGWLVSDAGDEFFFSATVFDDGEIIVSSAQGVSVTGGFDWGNCTASGSFAGPDGSGNWQLQRSGPTDGSSSSNAGDLEPQDGELGGPCYGNGTCNANLMCINNICEEPYNAAAGELGGPCYGNGTCNANLMCINDVCEALDEGDGDGSDNSADTNGSDDDTSTNGTDGDGAPTLAPPSVTLWVSDTSVSANDLIFLTCVVTDAGSDPVFAYEFDSSIGGSEIQHDAPASSTATALIPPGVFFSTYWCQATSAAGTSQPSDIVSVEIVDR